jgi:hypothetical protein
MISHILHPLESTIAVPQIVIDCQTEVDIPLNYRVEQAFGQKGHNVIH